jgi:hypothetical protein
MWFPVMQSGNARSLEAMAAAVEAAWWWKEGAGQAAVTQPPRVNTSMPNFVKECAA